ncbi:hypothetical protein F5Y13DRAFT_198886 [Hypoxylon sp. FL1857]|nr:hypothetical protein F5Y13DRAFT_198886 [Hypoxylon sp. FL1857]
MARVGIGSFRMVPRMVVFFATASAISFLALVAVILRLYSRFATKVGFGWDDGFILISMGFGIGLLNIEGILCISGIGYPFAEASNNKLLLIRLIMVHNAMFVLTSVTNNISILCFYLRTLKANSTIRMAAMTFIAFLFLWGLVSLVDLFAICHPGNNDTGENACNRESIMKDSSTLSTAGDIIVLLLPLPAIRNLHLNLRDIIKVSLLFFLGVVVTAIAILRYIAVIRQDFESPEFAIISQDSLAYAVLEANMGILCACLPMLHGLLIAWRAKASNRTHNATESPQNASHLDNNALNKALPDPPIPLEDRRYKYEWSVSAGSNSIRGQTLSSPTI